MNRKVNYDKASHTWSSPEVPTIFNKNCSIGKIALFMLNSKPATEICQFSVDEKTELTFGKVAEYAVILAQHFQNTGLSNKDVVGIFTSNTTLLTPVIVGCWLNGTPYHAVNPLSEKDVAKHLFSISKPRVIFCDGQHYEKLKEGTKELNIEFYTLCNHVKGVKKIESLLEEGKASPWYQPVPLEHGDDQTMAIYCTSGTTGPPKCVPYSNGRIVNNGSFINNESVVYSTSGPDWGTGLLNTAFNVLYGAKRVITTNPITTTQINDIITKYKVTILNVTPMQLAALVEMPEFHDQQSPNLQFLFVTGSPSSTKTLKKLKENFPKLILIENYGCTEFGSIALNTSRFETDVLGVLSSGVSLRIIDPDSRQALDYNQSGEICVHNKGKWPGYIGDDEANRGIFYEDNWIRSGDMGFMDENNILHFVDRYKDIMKYKGHQFSPTEIETKILEMKNIFDVCVFGVYDEKVGDQAAAAVVKVQESALSKEDIIKYVEEHEEVEYKRIHYGVYFVKKILRNSNGKILRNQMRDFCLKNN